MRAPLGKMKQSADRTVQNLQGRTTKLASEKGGVAVPGSLSAATVATAGAVAATAVATAGGSGGGSGGRKSTAVVPARALKSYIKHLKVLKITVHVTVHMEIACDRDGLRRRAAVLLRRSSTRRTAAPLVRGT